MVPLVFETGFTSKLIEEPDPIPHTDTERRAHLADPIRADRPPRHLTDVNDSGLLCESCVDLLVLETTNYPEKWCAQYSLTNLGFNIQFASPRTTVYHWKPSTATNLRRTSPYLASNSLNLSCSYPSQLAFIPGRSFV